MQPLGDIDCRKWQPLPSGTGRGAINSGSAGDLRRYRLNKTGHEGPDKVGSTGKVDSCVHIRAYEDKTDLFYGPCRWKYGLQADNYVSQNYKPKLPRLDEKISIFLMVNSTINTKLWKS